MKKDLCLHAIILQVQKNRQLPVFRFIHCLLLLFAFVFSHAQRPVVVGLGKQNAEPPYRISGRVYSKVTGEIIKSATIYIEKQDIGTIADENGEYSLTLYGGVYYIKVTVVGYEPLTKAINVFGPGTVNFSLKENIIELEEVILELEAQDEYISNKEVGKEVLNISSIKTLPLVGGEVNVLNSLALLPGVSSQGEVSSGLNIRGGSADQNLILLGGATLYNPYHLFGFFSGFDVSIVRDVSLYKGVIPARYGGRVSSVVDVSYKKGNFKQWEGDVTLGTVTSKFSTRGPLVKEKIALMGAGRIAYPNWLIKQSKEPDVANSTAFFYDGNLVLNYAIDEINSLEYSFYASTDSYRFPDDVENQWRNKAHALKWSSQLSPQLLFDISAIQSSYVSNLIDDTPFNNFDLERSILHQEANVNFNYAPHDNVKVDAGAQLRRLTNSLGELRPGDNSAYLPETIDEEDAIETGLYAECGYDFSSKLGISTGVRYSHFSFLGPGVINEYPQNVSRNLEDVVGTEVFGDEPIQTYHGWEPRVSLTYKFSKSASLKGGFNKTYQYIHRVTNTTTATPTDTWKLSDPYLPPQIGTQYAIGIFKNFKHNRIETSIQGFYKEFESLLEYKDGSDLFLNAHLETDLFSALGTAYGVELYLHKKVGKVYGWLSYTYSRSLRESQSPYREENINEGEEYSSNFDVPHNLSTVFNCRMSKRVTFSSVFNLRSGSPFTLPQGKFLYNDTELGFYQDRNNIRAPAIHRLDVSIQFSFPSTKKVWAGQWTFSVYNLYGRNNPFSVFFQDFRGRSPQAYQLSIIGGSFPSLNYEIK